MNRINESIFKRYDIRGKYPEEVNEEVFSQIGKSFAEMMESKEVVVGYDIRNSSESLFESLVSGINSAGAKVINLGLCSTPAFYFAVCHLKKNAGLMITASHLGKEFNGLKLVGKHAVSLTSEVMQKLKEQVLFLSVSGSSFSKGKKQAKQKGDFISKYNINLEYLSAINNFLQTPINKMKIIIDCGGGMASLYVKSVFKKIKNINTIFLFNELDGDFSGRGSNPKERKNRQAIAKKVVEEKADLGIMYDEDADRVYFLDSFGEVIDPNFVSVFIIEYLSSLRTKRVFVADVRSSKAIADTAKKSNSKIIISLAWHTKIKEDVKKNKAIFGSETSGHYIFGEFYNIDDGILASLIFLQAISENKVDTKSLRFSPDNESGAMTKMELNQSLFTEKIKSLKSQYHILEETNFKISSDGEAKEILNLVEKNYKKEANKILKTEGLSMEFTNWRFNLRQSVSEPLLRLNMEADSAELLQEKFKEISSVLI